MDGWQNNESNAPNNRLVYSLICAYKVNLNIRNPNIHTDSKLMNKGIYNFHLANNGKGCYLL